MNREEELVIQKHCILQIQLVAKSIFVFHLKMVNISDCSKDDLPLRVERCEWESIASILRVVKIWFRRISPWNLHNMRSYELDLPLLIKQGSSFHLSVAIFKKGGGGWVRVLELDNDGSRADIDFSFRLCNSNVGVWRVS